MVLSVDDMRVCAWDGTTHCVYAANDRQRVIFHESIGRRQTIATCLFDPSDFDFFLFHILLLQFLVDDDPRGH